jgi:hypothetical protein
MQIEIIGPVLHAPYIIRMNVRGFNQQPTIMYLQIPDSGEYAPIFTSEKEDAFLPPSIEIAYEALKKVKIAFSKHYSYEYKAKFSLVAYKDQ